MPTDIRVIKIKEFIKVDPSGAINFPRAMEILQHIVQSCEGSNMNILLDLRHTMRPHMLSDHQIWSLVEHGMKGFPETFRNKFALVDIKSVDYDREDFFVHCANAKEFPTKLFHTLEGAIDWLAESLEPPSSV